MQAAATDTGLAGALAAGWRAVAGAIAALPRDLAEIRFTGERARLAYTASLVVVLSVGIACAMHLPEVWWAAISGLISTQATRPASIKKGLLRIVGTAAGAALGLALVGWLAYDHVAACLVLLVVSAIGILGVLVSPHGYAWLFCGITFSLVVLMSLVDPLNALSFAVFRTIEVVIGTAVAIVVAIALAPEGSAESGPVPPGWTDLLGAQWPAVLHALRSGVAVATIPVVWSFFYLPGVSVMATTMASVLAVPVLSDHPLDDRRRIVEKAMHRLLGCFIGGLFGLALLAVPLTAFLPWLLALAGGTWLFAYLQGSTRGLGYVGVQAAVVFMMTLVQSQGPPATIMPGINRLAGIVLGMTTLLGVCLLLQPVSAPRPDAADAAPEAGPTGR